MSYSRPSFGGGRGRTLALKIFPDSFHSKRARYLLVLGFLGPCLLIGIMAFIGFRAERQLADSIHWVGHTIEVRRDLQQLLASVLQAESGGRGYLLTGRDTYLEPYRASLKRLPREIEQLRELMADNPAQGENLRLLATPASR